jgi:uncharacterized membrane protein
MRSGWKSTGSNPSLFGDLAVVGFLLAQACDGVFTYVGVATIGPGIEGNPLLATLIGAMGGGATLVAAKVAAGLLGILLHLTGVHRVVAALTCLYFAAAVVPWATVLFFQ